MSSSAQTVLVTKLRKTTMLGNAQIEQVFDAVNCPGLFVICVSGLNDAGELAPISEVYEVGDLQFDDLDEALLAWLDNLERARA